MWENIQSATHKKWFKRQCHIRYMHRHIQKYSQWSRGEEKLYFMFAPIFNIFNSLKCEGIKRKRKKAQITDQDKPLSTLLTPSKHSCTKFLTANGAWCHNKYRCHQSMKVRGSGDETLRSTHTSLGHSSTSISPNDVFSITFPRVGGSVMQMLLICLMNILIPQLCDYII